MRCKGSRFVFPQKHPQGRRDLSDFTVIRRSGGGVCPGRSIEKPLYERAGTVTPLRETHGRTYPSATMG